MTFVFALVPYRAQAPRASLSSLTVLEAGRALTETQARAVEMLAGGFRDTHLCVFAGGRAVSCGGIETDARQAWVRRDAGGRVTGAILLGRSGARTEVPAAIVIGADGRRSSVAAAVEARLTSKAAARCTSIYGYVPGLPNEGPLSGEEEHQ
mgnify:CR=1 FL=1